MMTCVKILCLLALCLTPCAATCKGNDSRCSGSIQAECNQLDNQGTDCSWDGSAAATETTSFVSSTAYEPEPATLSEASTYTTSIEPQPASEAETTSSLMEPEPASDMTSSTPPGNPAQGECIGNDSRCGDSSQVQCTTLQNQGSNCRWENPTNTRGAGGECSGNDSRCADSGHAKCIRLSQGGSDCQWESSSSTSANSGTCSGNDSRCSGKAKQSCDVLSQQGDCNWRADFTLAGSLTLTVTNASRFVQNPNAPVAIKAGISNLTGVPPKYIDVDLLVVPGLAVPGRRLRARELAQTETLLVTYVIVVGSDVPASVAVTGTEIGEVMKASNVDQIGAAISAKVKETFGNEDFIVVVTEVAPVVLTSSSWMNTTTSVSFNPSVTRGSSDGALPIGCTHPLLAVLGIISYLF